MACGTVITTLMLLQHGKQRYQINFTRCIGVWNTMAVACNCIPHHAHACSQGAMHGALEFSCHLQLVYRL